MEKNKMNKKTVMDLIVGAVFVLSFVCLIVLSYCGVMTNCGVDIWVTLIGILAVAGGTVSLVLQGKKLTK